MVKKGVPPLPLHQPKHHAQLKLTRKATDRQRKLIEKKTSDPVKWSSEAIGENTCAQTTDEETASAAHTGAPLS